MENKKYDIIIIGHEGENTFEARMVKELEKRGHYVSSYPSVSIYNQVSAFERAGYSDGSRSVSLDAFFHKYYDYGCDFIIICQTGLAFINDMHIPVFYYHREFIQSPKCENPTYILIQQPETRDFLKSYYMPLWASARNRQFLNIAADPSMFNPNREKDLKGINYISSWAAAMGIKLDAIWADIFEHYLEIPIWATENKLCTTHVKGNVKSSPNFNTYRDYMERSEASLMVTIKWIYFSRRLIEAAMCKTLNIIWIQNDASEKAHNNLGFYHRKNCIMFREKEELENGAVSWTKEELKEMTEDAYNLVLEKHTYEQRADKILAMFEGKLNSPI